MMRAGRKLAAAALAAAMALGGCGPLIVGGAGVVVADKVAEDNRGGDGLF
jgi:hypothetical protein